MASVQPYKTLADKQRPLIDQMVNAIVNILREKNTCEPSDLMASGFAQEDVEKHWAMAMALAHVQLNLMNS